MRATVAVRPRRDPNGFQDDDGCLGYAAARSRASRAIRGITFERRAVRASRALALQLDAAVKVLLAYPTPRLRYRGHTDSTGRAWPT
ncbi:MAG: hypothetical protein IPG96_00020 [Proteobacteria bacterium]|nr:hypothetical protein [Pseudomonadota bacterium]